MGIIGYSMVVYESHVDNLGDRDHDRIFSSVAPIGEDYDQRFEVLL